MEQRRNVMIATEEDKRVFEELARPLVKFLNDRFHPHVTVIITPVSIELVEGVCAAPVIEYLRDRL
jgi:hypothetical protein